MCLFLSGNQEVTKNFKDYIGRLIYKNKNNKQKLIFKTCRVMTLYFVKVMTGGVTGFPWSRGESSSVP